MADNWWDRDQLANDAWWERDAVTEPVRTATPLDVNSLTDPILERGESSWADIGKKFIQNVPERLKASFGGLAYQMGSQDMSSPTADREAPELRARGLENQRKLADFGKGIYTAAADELKANAPTLREESRKDYAYTIANGFADLVPALAAGYVTKSPTTGLALMGGQQFGTKYGEARAQGEDHDFASREAGAYAALETLTEKIPLGVLTKEGGKFGARVLKSMGAEGVQEGVTQAIEQAYEARKIAARQGVSFGEAWDQLGGWGSVRKAAVAGGAVGGGLAAVAHPLVGQAEPVQETAPVRQEPTFGTPAVQVTPEVMESLTEDDRASPIPDDIIAEGRQLLKDIADGKPTVPLAEVAPLVEPTPIRGARQEDIVSEPVVPPEPIQTAPPTVEAAPTPLPGSAIPEAGAVPPPGNIAAGPNSPPAPMAQQPLQQPAAPQLDTTGLTPVTAPAPEQIPATAEAPAMAAPGPIANPLPPVSLPPSSVPSATVQPPQSAPAIQPTETADAFLGPNTESQPAQPGAVAQEPGAVAAGPRSFVGGQVQSAPGAGGVGQTGPAQISAPEARLSSEQAGQQAEKFGRYHPTPEGAEDWGHIPPEAERDTGGKLKALPIRVRAEDAAEGIGHLTPDKVLRLERLGFKGIDDFIGYVARKFNRVMEQPNGRFLLVVRPGQGEVRGKNVNNAMVVELKREGDHYTVKTVVPDANESYLVSGGKTLLWRRTADPQADRGDQPPYAVNPAVKDLGQEDPGRLGQSERNVIPDQGESKAEASKSPGVVLAALQEEPVERSAPPPGPADRAVGLRSRTESDAETVRLNEDADKADKARMPDLGQASRNLGANLQKVRNALADRAQRYGINRTVAVEVVRVIDAGGGAADGRFSPTERLVQVALGAEHEWVFDHETIHVLKEFGAIKPDEWTALVKAARADAGRMARIREDYAELNLTDEQLEEEAVADMFADWVKGESHPKGLVQSAFERVRRFMAWVKDGVTGSGYTTPEAFFAAVQEGRVGKRATVESADAGEKFAVTKTKPRTAAGTFASPKNPQHVVPKGTAQQERAINKAISSEDKRGLWEKAQETYADLKTRLAGEMTHAFADEFHGLRMAGKALAPMSADRQLGSYVAARMARHAAGQIEAFLRHGAPAWDAKEGVLGLADGSRGFYDIVAPLYQKGLARLWEGYAYARRVDTQKLIDQGKEHNLTHDDVSALLDLAGEHPEFKKIFDQVQDYKKSVLDAAEAMGLISKEQRAIWEQVDHVPFYRAVDGKAVGPGASRGMAGQTAGVKKLTGGEESFVVVNSKSGEVVSRHEGRGDAKLAAKKLGAGFEVDKAGQPIVGVIENIARNFQHLIDASMKNHAAVMAVDEALQLGWAEKVGREMGQALVLQETMAKDLRNAGIQVGKGAEGVSAVMAIIPPKGLGKDVVQVRRAGEVEYYRVDDPLLFKGLTSLNRAALPAWLKPFTFAKTVLTRTVTSAPTFMIRNFVRDSLDSWTTNDTRGANVFNEVGRSIKNLRNAQDDPRVRALMAAGGDVGWYKNAPADVVAALKRMEEDGEGKLISTARPRQLLETWEKLGRAAEQANRLAVYEATLEKTGSKRQATFQAMDALDFQLKGGNGFVEGMMSIIPFLNARVQGLYRLGRIAGADGKARKSLLTKAAYMATFSTILALINADDDDYNDKPEWLKDTVWMLPVWHMYGKDVAKEHGLPKFLYIPKPFEIGLLFGTLPERLVQLALGNDRGKDTRTAVLSALGNTLALNPLGNPLMKETAEQYFNTDFFSGSPIVNQTLQYLPAGQQAGSGTSWTVKEIGDTFGISPVRLEHAIRGFTSGMGMALLAVTDAAARVLGVAPPAAAKGIGDMSIVKAFMDKDQERTTKWLNRFYETREEAETLMRGVKARAMAGDKAGAREMLDEHRGLLDSRKMLGDVGDAITEINHRMRAIEGSRILDPAQKRERLSLLTQKKNALAKRAAQAAEKRAE